MTKKLIFSLVLGGCGLIQNSQISRIDNFDKILNGKHKENNLLSSNEIVLFRNSLFNDKNTQTQSNGEEDYINNLIFLFDKVKQDIVDLTREYLVKAYQFGKISYTGETFKNPSQYFYSIQQLVMDFCIKRKIHLSKLCEIQNIIREKINQVEGLSFDHLDNFVSKYINNNYEDSLFIEELNLNKRLEHIVYNFLNFTCIRLPKMQEEIKSLGKNTRINKKKIPTIDKIFPKMKLFCFCENYIEIHESNMDTKLAEFSKLHPELIKLDFNPNHAEYKFRRFTKRHKRFNADFKCLKCLTIKEFENFSKNLKGYLIK